MRKKLITCSIFGFVSFFIIFYLLASSTTQDTFINALFISFLFVNPLFIMISSAVMSKHLKEAWYYPILMGILYFICMFTIFQTFEFVIYSILYIVLGYISMGTGYFVQRKQIKAEEEAQSKSLHYNNLI